MIQHVNVSGITTLSNKTIINGVCNIHGGNPYAVGANFIQKGSLTIWDLSSNYGGGSNWTTTSSAAGLLFKLVFVAYIDKSGLFVIEL